MNYPWYNQKECETSCWKFVLDHANLDMDLLRDMATTGSLDEFRTLCNCLYVHMYTPEDFYHMNYNDSRELRDLCNERVHAMLRNLDPIYNDLFKVWQSERWRGDESWVLFSDACKPFDEAKAILTLIELNQYLGQPLTVENLPKVSRLYRHGNDSDLCVEGLYSVHLEIPSEFKEANSRRREHTHRWRKFMSYIWEGDFTSGMQMIEQYNKEHAEAIEEIRKKNAKDS